MNRNTEYNYTEHRIIRHGWSFTVLEQPLLVFDGGTMSKFYDTNLRERVDTCNYLRVLLCIYRCLLI